MTNAVGKPKFQVKGFSGTVTVRNWIRYQDGEQYDGFHGTVSLYTDVEATGFEAKGHDTANWIARIEGPSGDSVNLLGCQVTSVIQTSKKPTGRSILVVP